MNSSLDLTVGYTSPRVFDRIGIGEEIGKLKRRDFLAGTGLAAAGILIGACDRENSTESRSRNTQEERMRGEVADGEAGWEEVRRQFNLSPDKIHMSALLVSAYPQPVREAVERYRRALDADPITYLEEQNSRRKQDVRVAASDYLGGGPDHIALTDSTTMGIALVYHGLPLQPGQEIVTTEHDYYATHETLRQVTDRTGATVWKIELFDRLEDVSEEQIAARITRAISSRTRVLALTWVHSSTGLKLPMQSIGEAIRVANRNRDEQDRVLLCLDGVHGFGVEDLTADELGCDFFMAGCHKWLFGPRGTGIVWAAPASWAQLRPMVPSFMDNSSWGAWASETDPPGPTTAERMTPGGFKPFEHQWAITEAFRFHEQLGKTRIARRTHTLAEQLKEGLSGMSHVRLITPQAAELSAGIVCFEVDGHSPRAVVDHLARRNIVATTTPYAVRYPRLTPCIYNTPEEIETVLREIRELS